MNINSLSVLLGGVGLVAGGLGLVARDIHALEQRPSQVESRESPRTAAWPPHSLVASVEFHDEMLELIGWGPPPPRRSEAPEPQTVGARSPQQREQTQTSPEGMDIRFIRTVRGSRRTQLVEIEFVDPNGDAQRRRYPVNRPILGAEHADLMEADQSATQSYGYSQRRSRRSGRGYYRRWR